MAACLVEGCNRPSRTRKMCHLHYVRWLKHGNPLVTWGPSTSLTATERFFLHVNIDGPIPAHRPDLGPCHEWTAYIRPKDGYGIFDGRMAHIFLVGKAPPGLTWDHLCFNKICVRPSHLEAVSIQINIRRSVLRRVSTGTADPTTCAYGHPLTPDNVFKRREGYISCRQCMRDSKHAYRARVGAGGVK